MGHQKSSNLHSCLIKIQQTGLHAGCHDATGFHLYLLHIWVTFNIWTIWGYQINVKFLMSNLWLLPGVLLLNFPRKVLNILPLPLLGTYSHLLNSVPFALEVMGHIKKPEVSLWGYETFFKHLFLYLCRSKIFKNKVNPKRSTRFDGLETWPQIRLQASSH